MGDGTWRCPSEHVSSNKEVTSTCSNLIKLDLPVEVGFFRSGRRSDAEMRIPEELNWILTKEKRRRKGREGFQGGKSQSTEGNCTFQWKIYGGKVLLSIHER
ncbi:hypothetical protein SLE2022_387370 [Rubroshorea leprosula]